MSDQPRHLSVILASRIESMDLGEEIARQVAETAGFAEEERYQISLAVRECLINAFQHGNQSDASKKIEMNIALRDDRMEVSVRDQGRGFDLSGIPDPRTDERLLATSGRGIFLIRTFMDELRVEREQSGGTIVSMTKWFLDNHKATETSGTEKEKQQ